MQKLNFLLLMLVFSIGFCACDNGDEPNNNSDYASAVQGVYTGTGTIYDKAAGATDDTFYNMRVEVTRVADNRVSIKMETSTGKSFFNSTTIPYCNVTKANYGGYILTPEWTSGNGTTFTVKDGHMNYIAPIKKNGNSGYTLIFDGYK